MKNKIYTFKTYMLLVFLFATTLGYSQIVLNTSPNTDTCNLSGDNVTVSVPSEALTGDNIALNITLPGSYDAGCVKTVSITNSSNLVFQSSGAIPFTNIGGGTYQNNPSPTLNGNDGHNFNMFYKFPGYTTCNGTVGTFDVTVTLDCAGVITTCTTSVSVIARADNYWSITKEFVTGDLTCGLSTWKIKLHHNNPNGSGLGTYKLSGTITESPSVPIVSGAVHTVNYSMASNSFYTKYVTLQNCAPEGTTITNIANYNFTLGDGTCGTMTGTVTADSDPLVSPNTDLSFVKYVYDNNGYPKTHPYFNIPPGCSGKYRIQAKNNGNVPWTNLVITDNLNIPGITITFISPPAGWSVVPTIPPYLNILYTFTAPLGFVLNPGQEINIWIDFEVNLATSAGTTITNAANIDYQASGTGSGNGNGGGPSPCPAISCPTIDTTLQNDSTTVDFDVAAPEPRGSIKKCILNPPSAIVPPIYQIGDIIEFSVMIGNSGAADLTTTLTDAFGMPGQNLEIQTSPGDITYEYYPDENRSYRNSCNPPFGAPITPPFPVNPNTIDLQNPSWDIINMPGICDYNRSNFLIIKFKGKVLPQLHGTKTNLASIPSTTGAGTHSSAVNYSIDQVGVLGIFKEADAEIVENGQSFNYIITVSNNGSVPLDNIVVTDMLPDCVSVVSGQISIEDSYATSIPFTTSGGLTITINPATQIFPGNDFTITIPVVKSGGGNCCNESVSVTANMTTSGVELNANYGSVEAPAACVTGTECCDIEGFDASIKENNGSFNVTINGGSVPIQEVEISMIDYHVEYSNPDCKPDDMGNFGTLSTSNTTLANLILNAGDNNTSSLTWLPGSPGILNSSVNLNIVDPLTLNLDCCDVTFSFCLKVRVKDVNCNVCEKIICYTSLQPDEPCNIEIKDIGQDKTYCPGDSITLNWSGSTPSSFVNISLFDNTNGNVYQVLATGIPNTGSYTYTIPASIPCDPPRSWSLIVEDSEKLCVGRSNTFTIECCHQTDCGCGEWLTNFVTVKGYIKKIPKDPKQKINFQTNFEKELQCGNQINLKSTMNYTFTSPNYVCNPENCDVKYKWEVEDPDGIILSGNEQTINYTFNDYGNYKIIFTPICGGKRCDPCIITVIIDKFIQHYPDPIGLPYELPTTGDVTNPKTGETWMNKNLGATRVATSSTDPLAYGDLYQWGRLTDGHEKRTSTTTSTLSTTNVPGHNKFIAVPSSPDWRSTQNNNLWQGVNGTNNPCPIGYRIPTAAEFNAERLSWITNDAAGAFASPLKWTMAGARATDGTSAYNNYRGFYLSSDIDSNQVTPKGLVFTTTNAYIYPYIGRVNGSSVRCIKN